MCSAGGFGGIAPLVFAPGQVARLERSIESIETEIANTEDDMVALRVRTAGGSSGNPTGETDRRSDRRAESWSFGFLAAYWWEGTLGLP